MGCSDSREDLTAEEATVINAEYILEYGNIRSSDLDYIHRKYSYDGKILDEQWQEIYTQLDLALNKSYTIQQTFNFYDNFKVSPTEYSLKKLLVFGILLSLGCVEEKAFS